MMKIRVNDITIIILLITVHSCYSEIECISEIKRFSAYPSANADDPSFYYECANTKFAVLKRCKEGFIYDAEEGSCRQFTDKHLISHRVSKIKSRKRNRRRKRNVQDAMKKYLAKKGVSEQANQPVLGRPIKLGALYYGAKERIAFDENLWNDNTLRNNASRINTTTSNFKLDFFEKLMDRLNLFSISASFKADLLSGKMTLKGSAEFLRGGSVSEEKVNVALIYESTRYQESISQEMRFGLDNADLCKKVDEPNGPTHVVSSITRGMNAVFEFQKKKDTEANKDTIAGSFEIYMETGVVGLGGSANISIKSDQKDILEDSEVLFYGDAILENIPSNANDSLRIIHGLPKLAQKSEAILSYGLSPITKFCDETTTFLNSLNEKIYLKITEIIEEFEKSKIKLDDILMRNATKVFAQTIGKSLNTFRMEFRVYHSDWTATSGDLLADIKSNLKSEKDLMKHISNYTNSPFELTKIELFLNNRRRELDALDLILTIDEKDRGIIVEKSENAEGNRCLFENTYALMFQLKVLPNSKFITKYLKNENNFNENDRWFWNEEIVAIAGARHKYLYQIFHENSKETLSKKKYDVKGKDKDVKKDVCVMVRIDEAEENATTSDVAFLKVLKDGEELIEDFWPPPKLPFPSEVIVSKKEIQFLIELGKKNMPFNETDELQNYTEFRISYEYNHTKLNDNKKNKTEVIITHDTEKMGENYTTCIKIQDEWNKTTYNFNVSLIFQFGFSPHFLSFPVISDTCSKPKMSSISTTETTHFHLSWIEPKSCYEKDRTDDLTYKLQYYSFERDKNNNETNQSTTNIIIIKGNETTIDDLSIEKEYKITVQVVIKDFYISSFLPRIRMENEKMEIYIKYEKYNNGTSSWAESDFSKKLDANETTNRTKDAPVNDNLF